MRRALIAVVVVVAIAGAVFVLVGRRKPHTEVTLEPGPIALTGAVARVPSVRSAGCSAPADRPVGRTFTVEGRTFHLWGPASREPLPLVVAFHGWGSNGRGFEKWFEMERYVDDAAFVAYPDADGQNWDYRGSHDLDFVEAIVRTVGDSYCVDPNHVLAIGFSYGARMANHLGCRRPSAVRAIVAAGGRWDAGETSCLAKIPVLVLHRTHDPTMPIADGREAADRWARFDGCEGTRATTNGCLAWERCAGGAVTFCEDPHFDPEWPQSWNHTLREPYRALAWRWFRELP